MPCPDPCGTLRTTYDHAAGLSGAASNQPSLTHDAARLGAALAGRYAIERELGAGGMATVYLAGDLKHHRKVAIKVLHAELGAMLGPERFLKEIDVMASLQHPHILPLFDSGSANGLLFYVMPFVEGETLRLRLERERQLPVDDATRIAAEVAEALAYAHGKGVVHRDIKPENILLQSGHALVADFGIAHVMGAAGEGRLTQTGISLGTPTYMSPEQAMGERTVDGRSDVYSLACVAYEMLGGQASFTGPTAQAIIARHALESVPSLTIIRNTVPPEVEATITKALAKAPADRYSSAGEFAEALRHPESQSALIARRATGAKRNTKQRRSRWVIAALGLVVALALGGVGYALRPHGGIPADRVTGHPRRSGSALSARASGPGHRVARGARGHQ